MHLFHRKNTKDKNRSKFKTKAMSLLLMGKWKEQRGLCALSGRKLDRSAHLDHILPVSRGGSNEICNLQWLDPMVNQAKSNMTDVEFLNLCQEVIKWRSKP